MKRRGFTLIELMVVIAIIIILAAIAIPNYLKMTERAKKSRIASDMATMATGLETFKTDWGTYPTAAAAPAVGTISWQAIKSGTVVFDEIGGKGGTALTNKSPATTATGEAAPLEYLKPATLTSIVDPFKPAGGGAAASYDDGYVYYTSDGIDWRLLAYTGSSTGLYMTRTDGVSSVSEVAAAPAAY